MGKCLLKDKTEFSKDNTLALKGIAIIMMMFHHLFRKKSLFADYKISFFPLNQEIVVQASSMFKICVSIFVFITGYGLMLSIKKQFPKGEWTNKQIFSWVSNRIIKTMAGFWIVAILAYIICQIIDNTTYNYFFKENGIVYGTLYIIMNFLGLTKVFRLAHFNSSWWYMGIAILFIISIPLFVKLFKHYGYASVLIAIIVVPRIIDWEFETSGYISFLFPLLLGMIFAEKNLMTKISNFTVIKKNKYVNKIVKFIIGVILVILSYFIYAEVPRNRFWEISYGVVPMIIICFLYEFILDIPIIKHILKFLGKHSMNIFLVHEFIRTTYLTDYIYSFRNFIKIGFMLLIISLGISICIEVFKKIIKYDSWINKLVKKVDDKICEMHTE